ncbi:hypothetical protein C0Q70_09962 [Pomacea canaliculata]|uniref:Uncharacterized protein n=1 Tax=Pomacea canaliculata TaxID=400727 RepID=A0A2T7PBA4_POMCA|nr:hypothetical protein C0Q70_09962 [Pomacea canaliculata]
MSVALAARPVTVSTRPPNHEPTVNTEYTRPPLYQAASDATDPAASRQPPGACYLLHAGRDMSHGASDAEAAARRLRFLERGDPGVSGHVSLAFSAGMAFREAAGEECAALHVLQALSGALRASGLPVSWHHQRALRGYSLLMRLQTLFLWQRDHQNNL